MHAQVRKFVHVKVSVWPARRYIEMCFFTIPIMSSGNHGEFACFLIFRLQRCGVSNFSEMNLYSPQIGCFFSIGERFKTGRLMNMLACWEKHQFDEQSPNLKRFPTKHLCFTTLFFLCTFLFFHFTYFLVTIAT